MTVLGVWIVALLNWLLPERRAVSVSHRTPTPVFWAAWPLRLCLPVLRLAPIHPPTHRRRP
jgi:hypothetical protein